MVNAQDCTDENPLWHSEEPYFDSFYCVWDLFRSQLPFLTILDLSTIATGSGLQQTPIGIWASFQIAA